MKSDIFISVIIPVYNTSEIILRQCIDSIINQSITEIEIILIDDGSTNNALDVLKEYEQIDPRIKVLTQKNQYAGNARNNGMDIAKGDYLCFFDSDDYCKKNYLEKLYFTAQSYGSDVVICEEDFHDIDLDIVVPRLCKTDEQCSPLNKFNFDLNSYPDYIFQISNGWPWDKLFKKAFIKEKGLRFSPSRVANDGYFVFMAMALAGTISKIDDRLVCHRMGGRESLSNTREMTWHDGLSMLYNIKKGLIDYKIYDKAEKSFLNYSLYYVIWAFENMAAGMGKNNLFDELKSTGESILEILKHNSEFYYDYSLYEKYMFIMNNTIDDYIVKYELSFPYNSIPRGSHVVIYAAGKYGKEFYRLMNETGYAKIVLWVDQRFEKMCCRNSDGVLLGGVESFKTVEFDYVLFTLTSKSTYLKVKNMLVENGVPGDKILFLGKG